MTKFKRFCAVILFAFPFFAAAGDNAKNDKSQIFGDLDIIKHAFQVSYAPAEWKMKYSGWDLESEINTAKNKVANSANLSTKDYQRIVKSFLNTTKDYHVSARFYSTEKASLPFRVKGANGRYFFSYIDRNKLSPSVFPFAEGDELLLFDGKPVQDVINEIMQNEANSNESTDRALAEIFLTNRSGVIGHVVPRGPITLTVLQNGASKPTSYQLIWNYRAEKIAPKRQKAQVQGSPTPHAKSMKKPAPKKQPLLQDPIFKKMLLAPIYEDLSVEEGEELPSDFIGAKTSFIPTLGRIWWKSSDDCPFHAYLFELSDRRLIGFLRIPSYVPEGPNDIAEFASIISFLQERSEALVIDQLDNPGGVVFYLYALASMLTDQPLITPRHRMMITQQEVYFANRVIPIFEDIKSDADAQEALGESFSGIPVTYQMAHFFLNFFHFIVDEWNAGRHLTQPFYLYGIDHINPDPQVRYTKPILVLVNGLDFSGGDFFPAILQDNNRVVVLGSRTAGAGGFITRLKFPNLNGISEIRFTASIAERFDKSPIENLGVTPDISYEISENDLQYDYIEYVKVIQNTLKLMLDDHE